jgi:hypothetical protein
MALNQYSSLNTLSGGASVVRNFSKELRRKAIPRDIYTNLRAKHIVYEGQRLEIPAGIYQSISPKDTAGANNVRVTMKLPINANILRGRTVALGTEVAPVVKTGTLYRAPYRFVVQNEPGYGEDKLDAEPYKLYQAHVDDLSPHGAAEEGLEIRMALIESNGWNLLAGSTAALAPAQWNRNFFICGLNADSQPAFHPTYATYTNRIVNLIDTVSGGAGNFTQTQTQMLSGWAMDEMVIYALRRRMIPLMGKRPYFVLTISQVQAAYFSNPNFVDTLGDRWTAQNRLSNDAAQNWIGILGKWTSASGADIYVTMDERLATLLPSGSAAPFGLAAHYMWPTDNDDRQLDNPIVRDASILHGAGAVVKWEPEPMHYINDNYDYHVRNGYGYAGVRGIQQLQFDSSPVDPTGVGREYFGSAVIVVGRYRQSSRTA